MLKRRFTLKEEKVPDTKIRRFVMKLTTLNLNAKKEFEIITTLLLILAITGWVDFSTGYELEFSLFYLVPISIATWLIGRRAGILLAFLSSATSISADIIAGVVYSTPLIPFWNILIKTSVFVMFVYFLFEFRKRVEKDTALARCDALTGLANRHAFNESVARELARNDRYGREFALAYIDVDHFKQINDTFGHHIGDCVLKTIADVMKLHTRSTDIPARLGGDEFGIIYVEQGSNGAQMATEILKEQLDATMQQKGWNVTFSIGVGVFAHPMPSVDAAVRACDQLMYEIKNTTRNGILVRHIPFKEEG